MGRRGRGRVVGGGRSSSVGVVAVAVFLVRTMPATKEVHKAPLPTPGSTSTARKDKPGVIIGSVHLTVHVGTLAHLSLLSRDYEVISTLGHGSFGKVKRECRPWEEA
jgi:hypothetical protein